MSASLSVRDVTKIFGSGSSRVEALRETTFEVNENEFVTLVGVSGCGKSTLLSLVAGLDMPTNGDIRVNGQEVQGPGRDRGMVFQTYTLFPWLTAVKNVEFALRDEGLTRKQRRAIALEHLKEVGLDAFANAFPYQLSGGMRQRVAIARALSYRPDVLLMDEPFGALDAQTRQLMQEQLLDVWEEHRLTVVFVTHDIDEAIFLSDRVLVMSARPGQVKEEVPVPLARPRSFDVLTAPIFVETKSRVFESVREEALRAADIVTDER